MYGMYTYDETGVSDADTPVRSVESAELTAAVQLALDRRDNGGDAAGPPQ